MTVEVLRPEWRRRAADFGHDLGCLGAVVGRGRGQGAVGRLDVGRLEGALAAMDRPGRSLARRDVVGLVARSTVDGAAVDRVEAMADGLLTSPVSDRAVLPAPERVATVGVEARWSAGGLLAAVREHDRTPGAWSHDARPGPSERGARGRAPDREPAREPGRHRGHDTVRGR